MASTDFFESLLLAHALTQQPFSIQDWYAGLWTADPTSSGSLTSEVVGASYERQPVSWDSAFSNSNLLTWAAATTDWGNINHVCLLNNSNKGSGNMLIFESRATLDANIGTQVVIAIGDLIVTVV